MKYFKTRSSLSFYIEPVGFDKYTEKEILQYALGANLYMPATLDNVLNKLVEERLGNIGSITLCLEDAIPESQVKEAQEKVLKLLSELYDARENNNSLSLPLLFIRVRNHDQFLELIQEMKTEHLKIVCGFVFPKFCSDNASQYMETLLSLKRTHNETLYCMPIIEEARSLYKENRCEELLKIKSILSEYRDLILNIRVGGTDFSSLYGLRRDIQTSIYDIKVVSDCLADILNIFSRQKDGYVVSGPVWEYYSWNKTSREIEGLKRELRLDLQNGFIGKTVIHLSQAEVVNEEYIVRYEDYVDATAILSSNGGVFGGHTGNKMNEVSPHLTWARKILSRAKVFGVANRVL